METKDRWGMLYVLTFCHFVNDYYSMVIPPLLPFLAAEFRLTYLQSGLLVFMSQIISAFMQPVAGYMADIHRWRKPAIVTGLAIYALMSVALALVPNYAVLLGVLFLMGLGGSTYHPQSTSMISFYFQKFRATASGIHGAGNPLGFVAAPVIVTALIALSGSWRIAAILVSIPGAVGALLAWRLLEEPRHRGEKGFFIAFGSGSLILLTLISGIVLGVFMGFTTFIPFYSQDTASIIPAAWWLPITLVPGIVSQPIGGIVADKIGRKKLIILGLGALTAALFCFVFSAGLTALVFSMLAGFCLGLLVPVCLIFAAELAVGLKVGTAVGILWGFSMGVGALTPLWVGYLRDLFPDFQMAFMSLVALAAIGTFLSCFLPKKLMVS
ncbi:MAG: MFS transporter [Desulfobacterales bacterium]|nr:MFS transporter [Desulfobacterales bacterium]